MGSHQLFEFTPGEEQCCTGIEYVTEVVSRWEGVASLPESPPHDEGPVTLRGETTSGVAPRAGLLPDGHEDDRITQHGGGHIVWIDPEHVSAET